MSVRNFFKDCKNKKDAIDEAVEIIEFRDRTISELEQKLVDIVRGNNASTEVLIDRLLY